MRDAKAHAPRFARHAQHIDTLGVLFGGIRASTQWSLRFQCAESGSPKDNSSAALRLKKVGHCNDLDEIAALVPQFSGVSRPARHSSGGIVLNVPRS
jgi:hypothetical protein